ncbi:E3 SUMO-protein ligase ZNF451 isoform X2 [Sinocyclocheilus rhinocerous]|uniref:E3 SUMO-protein ligase ZNF451 isoform X2 n=1 Tax=Sinocyclocheilus rhinocerous TaxID=307959 RepID=UPI0007BA1EB5|nr:PREDICTED: E3 SUMO-protein ligase ZNF451 isoform X2 [Sinocyclocheilus rhinocerous]
MSASTVTEDVEDEVEFVSEGPLRPVLECIDLLSDGEDEGGMSAAHTIEEQVDQQRAHAMSTLDRLARQVAVEKLERLEKCKAFKEKIISQQAHGQHELSVSHSNSGSSDAKRCVDIWLKMPGLQPGTVNSASSLWRHRSAPAAAQCSPRTCPVINCGRVYDNIPLLEGHLKRFDHSPCDPTITLRGSPAAFYACVACGRYFHSKRAWKDHVGSKVSFPETDGHSRSQSYQLIVCFACPACYLLFNIKDECLEHMSAKKHFTQSITLWEKKPSTPIPVPPYTKNRLIALCKDVTFTVKCTACAKVLTSHMEARAHFNVHCNYGCAIVSADQSVADIMRTMAVMGHCSSCPKPFFSLSQMEEHKELLKHEVKSVRSMDRALLYYSNYCEIQLAQNATACGSDSDGPSAKRKRLASIDSQAEPRKWSQLAWFCECGLRFTEEDQARKHLQAANQIFHKCAVCGKIMGESSIARLHMSRFHGGAHLTNFLFHCRQCKVEMPRMEDIMAHVGVSHRGHSYYQEREDMADDCILSSMSPKPSTSAETETVSSCIPLPKAESWLCRMCEDLFDSEAAVRKHCGDLSSHSFQRFACGHCPQKFFKDSTLRRHCANEHAGDIVLRYFCGLCDSMLYDTEAEFLEHYNSLHSQDYYCLEAAPNNSQASTENTVESPIASTSAGQLCPCMGSEKSREERKTVFTKCMKQLATENKCSYCCCQCDKNTATYAEIKTHILLTHKTQGNEKSFDVLCTVCSQSHKDIPSFHSHYHKHHCQSKPCASSRPSGADEKPAASASIINAEEIFPQSNVAKFQDVKSAITSRILDVKKEVTVSQDGDDKFDQDIKLALTLSAEEARKSKELDIALHAWSIIISLKKP